jgi:hypothetical protein
LNIAGNILDRNTCPRPAEVDCDRYSSLCCAIAARSSTVYLQSRLGFLTFFSVGIAIMGVLDKPVDDAYH